MDLDIAGKTALVTASSKGLGKASAMVLAREGANVVICARNEDALSSTSKEIEASGANVHAVVADVTRPESAKLLVDTTLERFGSLDILVANAGGPPPMRALDVDDQSVMDAINANTLTSIRLVQAAVPAMRNNNWGRICLITSRTIKEPLPGLALSNLSRSALWAWAKTAAQDIAGDGITLNTICPGSHATDRMKDLPASAGPLGDPADFGKIVAFLCSEAAAFVNATSLVVDGGAIAGL